MKITVFGAGYVGLVQAAGLTSTGNHVTLVDISKERIENLKQGKIPIFEPGLDTLFQKAIDKKLVDFILADSDEFLKTIEDSQIYFLAVGTPEGEDGLPKLDFLYSAAEMLLKLPGDLSDKLVVVKSTVPIGTGDKLEAFFKERGKAPKLVSNPEFLKQGDAVNDFIKPERVIVGTNDEHARKLLAELYHPFMLKRDRIVMMSRRSAELVKYACNSFLAVKISYINEMSQLAEKVGADIQEVRQGMITDSRIGDQFLFPGLGYGGSCLPKDTHALMAQANKVDMKVSIIEAADKVNTEQRQWALRRLQNEFGDLKGKTIALWGLSFKPKTDDLREAPSKPLIEKLIELGASVRASDPAAINNTKRELGPLVDKGLSLFENPYEATEGADALVVITEWPIYRAPDFDQLKSQLKQAVIFDARNIYSAELLKDRGFKYYGVGVS